MQPSQTARASVKGSGGLGGPDKEVNSRVVFRGDRGLGNQTKKPKIRACFLVGLEDVGSYTNKPRSRGHCHRLDGSEGIGNKTNKPRSTRAVLEAMKV